jgi:enoyl-[acyl-carrier protein] reductase II
MQRGADFLGCEVAIMCGAMSWVSERNLVAAISNAGGFGVIACGAMTPELLDAEIAATKALTAKPFGVNLITMHPQIMDLIAICARHQVSHVVLAGGLPPKGSIEAIKDFGAKVICFAPALTLAKKFARSGVDARRAAISGQSQHPCWHRKSCRSSEINCRFSLRAALPVVAQ